MAYVYYDWIVHIRPNLMDGPGIVHREWEGCNNMNTIEERIHACEKYKLFLIRCYLLQDYILFMRPVGDVLGLTTSYICSM